MTEQAQILQNEETTDFRERIFSMLANQREMSAFYYQTNKNALNEIKKDILTIKIDIKDLKDDNQVIRDEAILKCSMCDTKLIVVPALEKRFSEWEWYFKHPKQTIGGIAVIIAGMYLSLLVMWINIAPKIGENTRYINHQEQKELNKAKEIKDVVYQKEIDSQNK
jgi:hypothetical protein